MASTSTVPPVSSSSPSPLPFNGTTNTPTKGPSLSTGGEDSVSSLMNGMHVDTLNMTHLDYFYLALTGQKVHVYLKDKRIYSGLFASYIPPSSSTSSSGRTEDTKTPTTDGKSIPASSSSPSASLATASINLTYPEPQDSSLVSVDTDHSSILNIPLSSIVWIKAMDIPDHLQLNRQNSNGTDNSNGSTPVGNDAFTDSGIAVQNSRMNQRRLVSAEESGWIGGNGTNNDNMNTLDSLDDGAGNTYADNVLNQARSSKGWDQFTINREKFGVQSTYDETLYTTAYNEAEFTEEQKQAAIRLAREIENNTSTTNIHILEERGLTATLSSGTNNNWADMMMDEESMHSAVLRQPNGTRAVSTTATTVRTASVSYASIATRNGGGNNPPPLPSSSSTTTNTTNTSTNDNNVTLPPPGKTAYLPPGRRTNLPPGPTVNTTSTDNSTGSTNGASTNATVSSASVSSTTGTVTATVTGTTLPSITNNVSLNLPNTPPFNGGRTSPRLSSPTSSAIRGRNIPSVQPLTYEQKDQFIAESQKFSAKIGTPKSSTTTTSNSSNHANTSTTKDNETTTNSTGHTEPSSTAPKNESTAEGSLSTSSTAAPDVSNTNGTTTTDSSAVKASTDSTTSTTEPAKPSSLATALKKSGLNAGAKEFVPSFSMNPPSMGSSPSTATVSSESMKSAVPPMLPMNQGPPPQGIPYGPNGGMSGSYPVFVSPPYGYSPMNPNLPPTMPSPMLPPNPNYLVQLTPPGPGNNGNNKGPLPNGDPNGGNLVPSFSYSGPNGPFYANGPPPQQFIMPNTQVPGQYVLVPNGTMVNFNPSNGTGPVPPQAFFAPNGQQLVLSNASSATTSPTSLSQPPNPAYLQLAPGQSPPTFIPPQNSLQTVYVQGPPPPGTTVVNVTTTISNTNTETSSNGTSEYNSTNNTSNGTIGPIVTTGSNVPTASNNNSNPMGNTNRYPNTTTNNPGPYVNGPPPPNMNNPYPPSQNRPYHNGGGFRGGRGGGRGGY